MVPVLHFTLVPMDSIILAITFAQHVPLIVQSALLTLELVLNVTQLSLVVQWLILVSVHLLSSKTLLHNANNVVRIVMHVQMQILAIHALLPSQSPMAYVVVQQVNI